MTIRPVRLLLLTLAFSLQALASKLPTVFDGYITNVISPTEFDVGSQHVICDEKTTYGLEFLNPRSNLHDITFSLHHDFPLNVGLRVRVEGKFEKKPDRFVAQTIQSMPSEEEKTKGPQPMEGIGLIQEAPALRRDGQDWTGMLWVDGYPLQITDKTKLTDADGKPYPGEKIGTNQWASYKATHNLDGSIHAESISFTENQVDPNEKEFRDKSDLRIEKPDYDKKIAGKIRFHSKWDLDILADKDIQDYVSQLGEHLIPQYQKDLPNSNATKVNFSFYVVHPPSKWKEAVWTDGTYLDASSTFSGTILIPDKVLGALDNEAQLAALLSDCIAVTLEKDLYIHKSRIQTQTNLAWISTFSGLYGLPLSISNSVAAKNFWLNVNKRASRVGLRFMLQNGYDIREAPFAWTAAANKPIQNPQEPGVSFPALAVSLMNDLRRDYAATPYSTLKTNREAYQQMLVKLRADSPKLPKPKNTTNR